MVVDHAATAGALQDKLVLTVVEFELAEDTPFVPEAAHDGEPFLNGFVAEGFEYLLVMPNWPGFPSDEELYLA